MGMEIELIFRIAGIGVIVALLNQVLLRAERPDIATMTTLAGIIAVILMLIPEINHLFETVKSVFGLY
jgi:stage III sporulation protein AC